MWYRVITPWLIGVLSLGLGVSRASADELRAADVLNLKGDGPDGRGNTDDDTWGFWFEVVHNKQFQRLSLATASLTAEQRKDGIRDPKAKRGAGKVRGPIASMLPNGADLDGWMFHRDWDGRFEGVWADKKTSTVMVHPYAEKSAHCAVAITYRVSKAGKYVVKGKLTDLVVNTAPPHDGALWRVEHVAGAKATLLKSGGPVGDGKGPESAAFDIPGTALNPGDLVRLVIHPNRWWGTDLTRIDSFKIELAGNP